ncbi:hypothetical protein OAR29_05360, partial [Rhodospirillales bacterium]|nr:hypothetical protein [Rhodospirillales bacterium]
GKIFGGGLPFGFVGGTTKIMENIFDPASRGRHISENKPLIMGGTFTGNPLTLSGCNYLLDHLRENEEEIYTYIDRLSMDMRDSINQFCEEEKIAVRMSGIGSINRLIFSDQEIISARHRDEVETPPKIQSKIYAELLAKKIHVAGNRLIFLSTAHTPEEVSFIIDEIKRWDKLTKRIANKNFKVGICWRSLISIGLTGQFSSNLDDWGEILKIPNISFFELQYDESEKERQRAENLFNTEIHKLDNVDMMTEFEKISAICLNMDIVISAVTTVALIANASGARVWELRPEYTALDMSGLPCFPNRQIYSRGHSETWKTVLSQVAKDLNKLMNESRE